MPVSYKPDGYHTVTPYLVVKDADALLTFMQTVLQAEEAVMMRDDAGKIMHAEVRIGDSKVMLSQAGPEQELFPAMLNLYVEDCDAVYARAIAAGATSVREPADQFYGDRSGGVRDANGCQWWFATHKEDVAPEEMERRMAAMKG